MLKLPNWLYPGNRCAFDDCESLTAIEMTARLYEAINTIIEETNEFTSNIVTRIANFENATEKDIELFKTQMRQEFQDFIDSVELQVEGQKKELQEYSDYLLANFKVENKKQLQDIISYAEELNENTHIIVQPLLQEVMTLIGKNQTLESRVQALEESALNTSYDEESQTLTLG